MENLNLFLQQEKHNTFTKYPSIQTYHKIDRGILQEELSFDGMGVETVAITEKIDGSNVRIAMFNDDYLIGSREEWVYAKGDRVVGSAYKKIVSFLEETIRKLKDSSLLQKDTLYCFYGEFYGSHIQKAWQNYTKMENDYGYRIFDIWSMDINDYLHLFDSLSISEASNWRESNQQPWWNQNKLKEFCDIVKLEQVPYNKEIELKSISKDIIETYDFLQDYRVSQASLHEAKKETEGIVIRSFDRKYITKLRFEDYKKTIKRMNI